MGHVIGPANFKKSVRCNLWREEYSFSKDADGSKSMKRRRKCVATTMVPIPNLDDVQLHEVTVGTLRPPEHIGDEIQQSYISDLAKTRAWSRQRK